MDYGFGNFTPDLSQILANLPPEVLAQIAAETGQQYTAPAPVAQPVYTPEPAYAPGPLSLGAMGDLDFSRLDLSDIDVGAIPPSEPVYAPEPAPAPLAATATPEPAYVPGFTPALANAPFAPNLAEIMANLPPEVAAQVEAAVGVAPPAPVAQPAPQPQPEPVAAPAPPPPPPPSVPMAQPVPVVPPPPVPMAQPVPVVPQPEPAPVAQPAPAAAQPAPAPLAAAAEPTPSYVPGFTPSLERAGRFAGEGADVQLDASGGVPALSSVATTPNYLVRPTADLDPLTLALQEIDGQRGFQFVTNKGNAAGVTGKMASTKGAAGIENPTGFVPLVEGATYRIRNEKGQDQIVYTGTGEEGLRNVYALAQDLSAERGKKANWGVEMQLPGETSWRRVADDDPAKSTLSKIGKVVGTALPIATAFIPGLNVATGILAATAAGGAGAALAGRDPLKGAVMGGLGAAGGSLLGPVIQSGASGAATNLGSAIGTGVGTTAGGLATGQSLQNSLLGGVTAGGLSYLGGELLGPRTPDAADLQARGDLNAEFDSVFSDRIANAAGGGTSIGGGGLGQVTPDGIQVTGARVNAPINLGTPAGSIFSQFAPGLANGADRLAEVSQPTAEQQQDIVVTGTNPAAPPSIVAPVTSTPTTSTGGLDEIVVTARPPSTTVADTPSIVAPVGNLGVSDVTQTAIDKAAEQPAAEEKSTLEKIAEYLKLASLGTGLLGGLAGGSGAPARIPAGLGGAGGLGGVFTSQLPGPSMPGLTGGTGGARTAADLAGRGLSSPQDYYRYGYGPEQSFFSNVPQGARNTSTAYTGYAEGGYAVGGPGDGRDDKIPALLSDGEYVIDAETVALLGNGSTKAGADALDKFRVSIRKHKGRKMAKGDFSAKAKKPEQYLKKGRA